MCRAADRELGVQVGGNEFHLQARADSEADFLPAGVRELGLGLHSFCISTKPMRVAPSLRRSVPVTCQDQ